MIYLLYLLFFPFFSAKTTPTFYEAALEKGLILSDREADINLSCKVSLERLKSCQSNFFGSTVLLFKAYYDALEKYYKYTVQDESKPIPGTSIALLVQFIWTFAAFDDYIRRPDHSRPQSHDLFDIYQNFGSVYQDLQEHANPHLFFKGVKGVIRNHYIGKKVFVIDPCVVNIVVALTFNYIFPSNKIYIYPIVSKDDWTVFFENSTAIGDLKNPSKWLIQQEEEKVKIFEDLDSFIVYFSSKGMNTNAIYHLCCYIDSYLMLSWQNIPSVYAIMRIVQNVEPCQNIHEYTAKYTAISAIIKILSKSPENFDSYPPIENFEDNWLTNTLPSALEYLLKNNLLEDEELSRHEETIADYISSLGFKYTYVDRPVKHSLGRWKPVLGLAITLLAGLSGIFAWYYIFWGK